MPLQGGTNDRPIPRVYLFSEKFFLEVNVNSEVKTLSSAFPSNLLLPLAEVIK